MENVVLLVILLAILVLPTLLMQRKQKQHLAQVRAMQAQLKAGDQVVTTAGIHAVVTAVSEDTVTLEVASGVHVVFDKTAVLRKQEEQSAALPEASASENQPTHTSDEVEGN